ncbi:MAG: hypothetical protein HY740_03205 [Chloroflexi bacterium]|nr:hypothetical protein [Chloroflexota bacterium]
MNTKSHSSPFKINDCVRAKDKTTFTTESGSTINLSGWQGWITEIYPPDDSEPTVLVQWDAATLKDMPLWWIQDAVCDGDSFVEFNIYEREIEKAQPRGTQREAEKLGERLNKIYRFLDLGEEGERITAVLETTTKFTEEGFFDAWHQHLRANLQIPFEATVEEPQERGQIRAGHKIVITGIQSVEDLYGILIKGRWKNENVVFPLCDLKATDKKSPNYHLTSDYAVWFANRG